MPERPPPGLTIAAEPWASPLARALVGALDADLDVRYAGDAELSGEPDHTLLNVLTDHVSPPLGIFVVARIDGEPVGCGALRPATDLFGAGVAEVKRMYVVPEARGRGMARALLADLEAAAARFGYGRVVLETGLRQAEAIALYESSGYTPIPNYGAYRASSLSRCYTKDMAASAVSVFTTAAAADAVLADIRRLMAEAFDVFTIEDWHHTLGGWHAVVTDGGAVVAHAAVVPRVLHVAGRALRTGYVEGVATAPSRQGAGLGSIAMARLDPIIRTEFELGALSTGRHSFYERLGWERWRGPTFVRDGEVVIRTDDEDDSVMVLRFGASADVEFDAAIMCDARPGDDW